MSRNAKALARLVGDRAGDDPIDFGVVLGPGLDHMVYRPEWILIPYSDLPGFPIFAASGSEAMLAVGQAGKNRIAVFSHREDFHDNGNPQAMRLPLEMLKELGAKSVFLTNSAGALNPDILPGDLMLISDHLNFGSVNPLVGETSENRFLSMNGAYDAELRKRLRAAAEDNAIPIHEGVLGWFAGPSYETPAEIRALGIIGADAVGSSIVLETILARFLGLRVAGMSCINNVASGLSGTEISHDMILKMQSQTTVKLEKLLTSFLYQE